MLILKQEDYNKIVDHAKKGLPNEACGLLGGYVEGDKRVVTDVYLLRNVDESREHFSMDPAEQLAAIRLKKKISARKKAYFSAIFTRTRNRRHALHRKISA